MTVTIVPLGEVASIVSGFAFKSDLFNDAGDGLPIVRIRDVTAGTSRTFYSGTFREEFVVDDGDALVGMDGEFNLGIWRGGRSLLNQRVCRIEAADKRLSQEYLVRFLPRALKDIEARTPFVTVKHLSAKELRAINLPLPPIPEQRRIAAILDKADALRATRREAVAKLDQLLKSVFLDMFSGSDRWPMVAIGDMCEVKGGKRLPKGEDYSESVTPFRYIRVSDIEMGHVHEENLRYLKPGVQQKIKRYTVSEGDLIISIAGTIGLVAPVETTLDGANLTENAARIVPKDVGAYVPEYLSFALSMPDAQSQIRSQTGQVTIGKLALFRIEKVKVPLPPVEAQIRFSEIVRRSREQARTLLQSANQLDSFFASLQYRAFSGTL